MKTNINEFSARIAGIGSKVPEKIVTNDMLAEIVETSDEWIKKRTGISERRVVVDETCTSMAVDAVNEAINSADIDANDIDLIIGTTITADYLTPSMASLVQREIGCENAISFDISAGCTAFIYAISIAVSMMESMGLETAVVVSSETLSTKINWQDRSTCVLFGDGSGAVVIQRSDKKCIKYPLLNAIPDTDDVLYMASKSMDNPWSETQSHDDIAIYMKGTNVFEFAVGAMEEAIKQLQELMGEDEIHKLITHQANSRIIRFAASNTYYDKSQFYVNVDKYANTSSATIPIAMCEAYKSKWLKKGDNIALVGFGAGLTYGGIVVTWDMD